MLTGQDLLDFVEENEDLNDSQLAVGAGYTRTTKAGKEQILVKRFYSELLSAKGTSLRGGRGAGKAAKFLTTVHTSGVILLGKAYSAHCKLEPGDQLSIEIDDEGIHLLPTGEKVEPRAPKAVEEPKAKGKATPVTVTDARVEELVAA